MKNFCWKAILLLVFTLAVLWDTCLGQQWSSGRNTYRDRDDDDKKPYQFNDAELTAIQAIVAFREVIGELLQKVGFNLPSIASIITRSDMSHMKVPMRVPEPELDVKSSGIGSALLRGMALSLPLLIPMATQMRRMASDPPYIPPIPFIPDPYYNRALHRRRGRRSVTQLTDSDYYRLRQLETIIKQIESMNTKYNQK